ncbi:hypothetical protein M404DRAFT_35228 [Pisolithus tinctorius Marx 270]|uniref:Uncharacterized protein n=1 Tax=Pisolithus tinctorius Marx 270 TaxID=870435 RepID=A0A0C3MZI5_PISTI|nr:hypothetical protein M404DRAFT_35228 [Pisolithus tinctorius Marx 270]
MSREEAIQELGWHWEQNNPLGEHQQENLPPPEDNQVDPLEEPPCPPAQPPAVGPECLPQHPTETNPPTFDPDAMRPSRGDGSPHVSKSTDHPAPSPPDTTRARGQGSITRDPDHAGLDHAHLEDDPGPCNEASAEKGGAITIFEPKATSSAQSAWGNTKTAHPATNPCAGTSRPQPTVHETNRAILSTKMVTYCAGTFNTPTDALASSTATSAQGAAIPNMEHKIVLINNPLKSQQHDAT